MSNIYIRRTTNDIVEGVVNDKGNYLNDFNQLASFFTIGSPLPPLYSEFISGNKNEYVRIFRTNDSPIFKGNYNASYNSLALLYQQGDPDSIPYDGGSAFQVQVNGSKLELKVYKEKISEGVQISGLQLYVTGVELYPHYDAEDASGYLTTGHQLDGNNWIVACNTLIAPTDPANPTDAVSILYLERNNNVVIDVNGLTDITGATTPAYDSTQPIASFPIKNGATAILKRTVGEYTSMIVQTDTNNVSELSLDELLPV